MILLWFVNLFISIFNAWSVGKTWTETKMNGGFPHFMSWMGATMSAVGFTWCYSIVLALIASVVPIEGDGGVSAPLLSPEDVKVFADLVYLILIFPAIGSGIAIMTHSWGVWMRSRAVGDGITAGWNTFANLSNMYSAYQHTRGAWDNVGDFFSLGGDGDNKGMIIILLVVLALGGGILTTAMIIRNVARKTAMSRAARYA